MKTAVKKTVKKYAAGIPVIALVILLAVRPERYSESVLNGFKLFVYSVMPSLFPFLFFSKILTSLGVADDLSAVVGKPLSKCYRVPSSAAYILVISMLSGYPIAAKLVAEALKCGKITQAEAKRIIAFSMTSGPLFILGTVGSNFFRDKTFGFIVLISHYLSSFINGFLYLSGTETVCDKTLPPETEKGGGLSDAVYNTVGSVMLVGSLIALFSMLVDVLTDAGVFYALAKAVEACGGNFNTAQAFFTGLVEMTRGCLMLSKFGASEKSAALAAAMISMGGASVTIQAMTFLSDTKISAGYYLRTKTTHAFLAAITAYLISSFFY